MDIGHKSFSNLSEQAQDSEIFMNMFELAQDLFQRMDHLGIIDRIKEVRQLGALKVPKKYSRSRYDCVYPMN